MMVMREITTRKSRGAAIVSHHLHHHLLLLLLHVPFMLLWTLLFFSSLIVASTTPSPAPSPATNSLFAPSLPPSIIYFAGAPGPSSGPPADTGQLPSIDRKANKLPVWVIVVVVVLLLPLASIIKWRLELAKQAETRFRLDAFLEDIAWEKPVRFTSRQLKVCTNNYSTILGSGGFGKVYLGQLPNGVPCAVKVLKRNLETKTEEQFKAEVITIGRTYHINLVRLYGFCYDNSSSALVYEYMKNGSLDKYLFCDYNNPDQTIGSWERFYEIGLGTAKGMAYLHEECRHRIIHYDIKPANILLDDNFSPKIADFGLAKLCDIEQTHVSMTGYRGTPGYSAPELFHHKFPVSYKCDVYSFGMLLFEILGRRKNVNVHANRSSLDWFPEHVWEKYEKGELEELTNLCGIEEEQKERAQRLVAVALWCVQDSPRERPQMSAVVKMLEGGMEILPPPKPFKLIF